MITYVGGWFHTYFRRRYARYRQTRKLSSLFRNVVCSFIKFTIYLLVFYRLIIDLGDLELWRERISSLQTVSMKFHGFFNSEYSSVVQQPSILYHISIYTILFLVYFLLIFSEIFILAMYSISNQYGKKWFIWDFYFYHQHINFIVSLKLFQWRFEKQPHSLQQENSLGI